MNRFVNFGTYESIEADWLKNELEKAGIPVKVQYPGTEIGRESSGGASWTALTLLIPEIELDRAGKIREKLRIKPVESIRLSGIIYNRVNRIAFGVVLFFWLSLYVLLFLPEKALQYISRISNFDVIYFGVLVTAVLLIFANTAIRFLRFYLKK